MKPLKLVGERFGKLLVIERLAPNPRRNYMWRCLCDCGKPHTVSGGNLRGGVVKSCGCWRKTVGLKHGHCRSRTMGSTPEHKAWMSMKARCRDTNKAKNTSYLGVTIDPRWIASFNSFLTDVGPKPFPHYSLDRIDPNGNYEPCNVRWADASTQSLNTRRTRNRLVRAAKQLALQIDILLPQHECGLLAHTLSATLEDSLKSPVSR